MRKTTLVLIVAGVALLAVALWLGTVMPIRREVSLSRDDEVEVTQTLHRNLWGTLLRVSVTKLFGPVNGKRREVRHDGEIRDGEQHGPWSFRERYDGNEWTVSTEWFIGGRMVDEEEWNAYLRGQ